MGNRRVGSLGKDYLVVVKFGTELPGEQTCFCCFRKNSLGTLVSTTGQKNSGSTRTETTETICNQHKFLQQSEKQNSSELMDLFRKAGSSH